MKLLSKHVDVINHKVLPEKGRLALKLDNAEPQADKAELLAFTTALMLREMVAQKHWKCERDYTIAHALQEVDLYHPSDHRA